MDPVLNPFDGGGDEDFLKIDIGAEGFLLQLEERAVAVVHGLFLPYFAGLRFGWLGGKSDPAVFIPTHSAVHVQIDLPEESIGILFVFDFHDLGMIFMEKDFHWFADQFHGGFKQAFVNDYSAVIVYFAPHNFSKVVLKVLRR